MNRIAELRKERHLNQVGLAMKLNISQYMISAYETGRHQPTIDILRSMSKFFNVSIDYIVGNSNIRYKAEDIMIDSMEVDELEMWDMFKKLSKEKRQRVIGIISAVMQVK